MNRVLLLVCCLALGSAPLLAQKKAAGASMTDQQFVDFAAQTDMVEANLGQQAQNAAAAQGVKDYGQMLVTDHTADYKNLQNIASQANVTVSGAIDAELNKTMIGPFQKLKGKAFDTRYMHDMVAGHTKALAIYKKEASSAQNPALQTYAQQAVPVLQKHLDDAKAVAAGKTPNMQ